MASKIVAVGGSCLFFFVAPGVVAGLAPYVLSDWEMRAPLPGLRLAPLLGGALVVVGGAVLVDCLCVGRASTSATAAEALASPTALEVVVPSGCVSEAW